MKFLQNLLIFILVIMAIRLLWRAFGPSILRWMGKKALQKVQSTFEKRAGFQPQDRSAGTKVVDHASSHTTGSAKEKKVVGEYVDFEEIE